MQSTKEMERIQQKHTAIDLQNNSIAILPLISHNNSNKTHAHCVSKNENEDNYANIIGKAQMQSSVNILLSNYKKR